MYRDKTIAVIVPAYNEEKLIGKVLKTIPPFVDHIVVVDDASLDQTGEIVKAHQKEDPRIVYIEHQRNEGVGGAIITGYKWARDNEISISVVMAGDAQMDPKDLPLLLDPVVDGEVDYSKGNRLFTGKAWRVIPKSRYLGNAVLSFLTKIASGYWHVADSQSGYGAVTLEVLKTIDLDSIYKRYGMPNDFLVRLNVYHFRVRDVSGEPYLWDWGTFWDQNLQSGVYPFLSAFEAFLMETQRKIYYSGLPPIGPFLPHGFRPDTCRDCFRLLSSDL